MSGPMCDAAWCGHCCLVAGRPDHRPDCPFDGTTFVAVDRFWFELWVVRRRLAAEIRAEVQRWDRFLRRMR